jgi:hypothetical protein
MIWHPVKWRAVFTRLCDEGGADADARAQSAGPGSLLPALFAHSAPVHIYLCPYCVRVHRYTAIKQCGNERLGPGSRRVDVDSKQRLDANRRLDSGMGGGPGGAGFNTNGKAAGAGKAKKKGAVPSAAAAGGRVRLMLIRISLYTRREGESSDVVG